MGATGEGLQQCSSDAFKEGIDVRRRQSCQKKHMSRHFDPGLPPTNRNFDDASRKVHGTCCAAAAVPKKSGMVFTQFNESAEVGHSWHPQ